MNYVSELYHCNLKLHTIKRNKSLLCIKERTTCWRRCRCEGRI